MNDRLRLTLTLLLSAALWVGLAASPAFAQSPGTGDEPTKEELKRAGDYFQKGAEAYTAGEYSKAIVEFLRAYNEVPNALFLYNISLSYGKLGNVPDALAAAIKAREGEGLDDQTANRNLARIAAYQRWDTATQVASDVDESMSDVSPSAGAPDDAEGPTFGGLGWVGAGLIALGGGLSVGSAVIASGLREPIEDYKRAGEAGDADTYDELQTQIRSEQNLGKALLFAGTGAATVGLVFVLIDLGNGPNERPAAFLTPTSDGGLVAGFHTRF